MIKRLLFLIPFLFFAHLKAQEAIMAQIPDSLFLKLDSIPQYEVVKDYLSKAARKAEKNGDIDLEHTYLLAQFIYGTKNEDSIVIRLKELSNLEKGSFYMAEALFLEGGLNYDRGNYLSSFKALLKGISLCKKLGLSKLELSSTQLMATLMQEYGDFEGSLKKLEEIEDVPDIQNQDETMYMVHYSKIRPLLELGKINKAEKEYNKALYRSKGDESLKHNLQLAKGIIDFYKGRYDATIYTLTDLRNDPLKKEFIIKLYTSFYLGKCYGKKDSIEQQIFYFNECDSMITETRYLASEFSEVYKILASYYGSHNKTIQQLAAMTSLIRYDSLLNENNYILQKTTSEKFLIPEIKEKNEAMVHKAEMGKKKSILWAIVVTLLLLSMVTVNLFNLKKTREKNRIFRKYMELRNIPKTVSKHKVSAPNKAKLDAFFVTVENEQLYNRIDFGRDWIAKKAKVNEHVVSDYMTEVIERDLKTYIHDARTDYAIRLMQDPTSRLHKLSLQGMAEEVGYRNKQTFNSAFKQRTGLRPLEFLERIKNKKVS